MSDIFAVSYENKSNDNYNIKNLAEQTGMSVKIVKHYLDKYAIEEKCEDALNYGAFGEKHVKMLKLIKEVNKSKYFSQPLASHYIQQIKTNSEYTRFPRDCEETLNRLGSLIQEIKELKG